LSSFCGSRSRITADADSPAPGAGEVPILSAAGAGIGKAAKRRPPARPCACRRLCLRVALRRAAVLSWLIYLTIFVIILSMRLNRQQIEHMAFALVKGLLRDQTILTDDREKVVAQIQELISRELEKEDQLDEQVKEILKEKLNDIRNSNIDYYEMFKMVKSKLAEKENIIL
jgi:hypothetical protein